MSTRSTTSLMAFLAGCLGIAVYSFMDAAMKELGLALGAYTALVWRFSAGTLLSGGVWALSRPRWPARATLRLHAWRAVVVAGMAILFFHSITLLPLAEAIALSFIAPLIALYLAAITLGERIGRAAIIASVLGIIGVVVILLGRVGEEVHAGGWQAWEGVAAVLGSAVLYAYNLILARKQAQIAPPAEIAFFQTFLVLLVFLPFAPWFLRSDLAVDWWMVFAAAGLSVVSLWIMSWAYARAEAQVLIPVEYTAFIWAAVCGWIFFDEALTWPLVLGTVLIVAGCLINARATAGKGAPVEHIEEMVA